MLLHTCIKHSMSYSIHIKSVSLLLVVSREAMVITIELFSGLLINDQQLILQNDEKQCTSIAESDATECPYASADVLLTSPDFLKNQL